MREVRVKAPAKINLTLEVLGKREDGFHNIQSIMQAISLYDYLTVTIEASDELKIELLGTSKEIPYDSSNLVYKAAMKFVEAANIKDFKIRVFIEKNIPIAAGLAGGSTDAAATFFALNHLFSNVLSKEKIGELCASLGSDLNFCLDGGCALCTSRGELIEKLPQVPHFLLSLIKPKAFGISAKEAYTKFAKLEDRSNPNYTSVLKELIEQNKFDKKYLYNSLEKAVINDYKELGEIKTKLPESIMSGSGPTFFVLKHFVEEPFERSRFDVIQGLESISDGVSIAE